MGADVGWGRRCRPRSRFVFGRPEADDGTCFTPVFVGAPITSTERDRGAQDLHVRLQNVVTEFGAPEFESGPRLLGASQGARPAAQEVFRRPSTLAAVVRSACHPESSTACGFNAPTPPTGRGSATPRGGRRTRRSSGRSLPRSTTGYRQQLHPREGGRRPVRGRSSSARGRPRREACGCSRIQSGGPDRRRARRRRSGPAPASAARSADCRRTGRGSGRPPPWRH